MSTHVKVVAALFCVCGATLAALAFFAPVILGLVAALIGQSGDPDASTATAILGLTGIAAGIFFGALALPYLVTAWGLWNFRPWARIVGIVLGAISLPQFPLGTLVGVYALVIFFRKDTEALFVARITA